MDTLMRLDGFYWVTTVYTTGIQVARWDGHEQCWWLTNSVQPITREEVDAVEVLSERLEPPEGV